jgi:hypothetical protein
MAVYNQCWKRLYFPDDACVWYVSAHRRLRELLAAEACDALITVSLPFTGHVLGLALRRDFPQLPWLADIGDPFTIQPRPPNNPWLYHRRSRRLELQVLCQAHALSVTTNATREKYAQVFGASAVTKMQVIPPLWHPWQEPNWDRPPRHPNSEIHLGYFGNFYKPTRTPAPLFAFLDGMRRLAPELHRRLRVHIFGDIFPEFVAWLKQVPYLQLHGLRPREEAQTEMGAMDVLLNIGNTTNYQLPSKAVNYLAAARPVINLVASEGDPFAEFWGDWPGLFSLVLRERGVPDEEFRRCADFLLAAEPAHAPDRWRQRMRDYSAAAIAERYLQLLRPVLAQSCGQSRDIDCGASDCGA